MFKSTIKRLLAKVEGAATMCTPVLAAAAFAVTATPTFAAGTALPLPTLTLAAVTVAADEPDVLILRDGREIIGKVVSETDAVVTFKGKVKGSGIEFTNEYSRADILSLKKGVSNPAPKADASKGQTPAAPVAAEESSNTGGSGQPRVYFLPLDGLFGQDITQTPIREAVRDAQKNNVDILILRLNNEWRDERNPFKERLADDEKLEFNELFRYESIAPTITDEIAREWTKQPKVVCWVKNAMGGAAFIPLCVPNIYMTSDARIGGIGGLEFLLKGVGDETPQQKQYSLRLGHARGWAIKGGYDSRIVDAMTVVNYVLSYRYVGEKVEFLERAPESADEIPLTWAGGDTVGDRIRGTGKDWLTITAKIGKDIGLSKGTANTEEELLYLLGLDRDREIVRGNADKIMGGWKKRIENVKKEILTSLETFRTTAVEGTYEQRQAAYGKRMRALENINRLTTQYAEALTGQWLGQNRIPPEETLRSLIELERINRQKEKKR
jgi:hypothetical protein